jgi:hypothetical protein
MSTYKEKSKMANSKVGQYQIEYRLEGYGAPARSHALRVWVQPASPPTVGELPENIDIALKGGATKTLKQVIDQFWSFVRLSFPTGVIVTDATLWRFATENSRDFISAAPVASPTGSTGSVAVASQATLTFRHAGGGIGKIVLLESNSGGSARVPLTPNAAGTAPQRLAAYLLSADSPMIALDNTFPVAALRDSRGENEALFRLIFRGSS